MGSISSRRGEMIIAQLKISKQKTLNIWTSQVSKNAS